MALQRTVSVDLGEADRTTASPNGDADEPGFSKRTNEFDSLGPTFCTNIQTITIAILKSKHIESRLQYELLVFRRPSGRLLVLIRKN